MGVTIDVDVTIERRADPKGDRVRIGMTDKFLPFRYYGATGNEQALGYGGAGGAETKREGSGLRQH